MHGFILSKSRDVCQTIDKKTILMLRCCWITGYVCWCFHDGQLHNYSTAIWSRSQKRISCRTRRSSSRLCSEPSHMAPTRACTILPTMLDESGWFHWLGLVKMNGCSWIVSATWQRNDGETSLTISALALSTSQNQQPHPHTQKHRVLTSIYDSHLPLLHEKHFQDCLANVRQAFVAVDYALRVRSVVTRTSSPDGRSRSRYHRFEAPTFESHSSGTGAEVAMLKLYLPSQVSELEKLERVHRCPNLNSRWVLTFRKLWSWSKCTNM